MKFKCASLEVVKILVGNAQQDLVIVRGQKLERRLGDKQIRQFREKRQ